MHFAIPYKSHLNQWEGDQHFWECGKCPRNVLDTACPQIIDLNFDMDQQIR